MLTLNLWEFTQKFGGKLAIKDAGCDFSSAALDEFCL